MSCGVGCSRGLDSVLLWLWCPAPIVFLAWKPPYDTGLARKSKKKPKKQNNKKRSGKGAIAQSRLETAALTWRVLST